MEGLQAIPYLALVIAISGIVIGAGVIVSDKFEQSITDKCWNSSFTYEPYGATELSNECNATIQGSVGSRNFGEGDTNLSRSAFAVTQSIDAQGDIAEQLPTVGIIAIMVVIISIIAGVFVYLQYFS